MEIVISSGYSPEINIDKYTERLEKYQFRNKILKMIRNISIIGITPFCFEMIRNKSEFCLYMILCLLVIVIITWIISYKYDNIISDIKDDLKYEEDNITRSKIKKLWGCSETLQKLKDLESSISINYFKPEKSSGTALEVIRFESYWQLEQHFEILDNHVKHLVLRQRSKFEDRLKRYDFEEFQRQEIKNKLAEILRNETKIYHNTEFAKIYEEIKNDYVQKIKTAAGCLNYTEKPMLIVRCVSSDSNNNTYESYKNYYAKDIKNILENPS